METSPLKEAHEIEQAEIHSDHPASVGLNKLREEYAVHLSADGQDKADAFIHSVREHLIDDNFMAGITYQAIASSLHPGEKMTDQLEIYSSTNGEVNKRQLEPSSDLESALQDDFAYRFAYVADGVRSSLFSSHFTTSYSTLIDRIKSEDNFVKSLRVREELKTQGPDGPLWKILQDRSGEGRKITIDTIDGTLQQQASKDLSPEQVSALNALKNSWDADDGAKRFRVETHMKFYPLTPLAGLNPLASLSMWNYISVFKRVDYLSPKIVRELVE
jgi:hypothetical protein